MHNRLIAFFRLRAISR